MEQKALTAPFAGIIGIPQIEVGAYVQPGTVYATLQDLDTLRVDFSVPEQQIRLIEIGMPLTASTEVDGSDRHRHDHRDRAADRPELAARRWSAPRSTTRRARSPPASSCACASSCRPRTG